MAGSTTTCSAEDLLRMPDDGFSEVREEALSWLAAGTRLVLVIDPVSRTRQVYRPGGTPAVLHEREEFRSEDFGCADVVPNWIFRIGELFR
jgi:hypothetical protein